MRLAAPILTLLVALTITPLFWQYLSFPWWAPWSLTAALNAVGLFVAGLALRWLVTGAAPSRAGAAVIVGFGVILMGGAELFARQLPRFIPRPTRYVGEHENRPSRNFIADERLGWRMKSRHSFEWQIDGRQVIYRSDRDGFRISTSTSSASGGRPVVFVGDSFTFGFGVPFEETFASRLGAALGTPVVNLALPGYGVDQMSQSLRFEALPLRPRAIVVAFIDYDLGRSLTAYRSIEGMNKPTFVVDNGALRLQTPDDRPFALLRWIEARSYLYTAMLEIDRRIGRWFFWGYETTINRRLFERMAQDAARAETPILFIRLPLPPTIDNASLERIFDRLRVAYIDLAGSAVSRPGPIHFDKDDHIDGRGHRWVAEQAQSRLAQLIASTSANRRTRREP